MRVKRFKHLYGKYVNLRDIEISDSEFVLTLRTDEQKAKFLHKTEYDVKKQNEYIKNYKKNGEEYYFISELKNGEPVGTIRIYDLKDDSFGSGSWLAIKSAPANAVVEADLLMKKFGFYDLGYSKMHFNVDKGNVKVIYYHKMLGANIISENDNEYYFELTRKTFEEKLPGMERLIEQLT